MISQIFICLDKIFVLEINVNLAPVFRKINRCETCNLIIFLRNKFDSKNLKKSHEVLFLTVLHQLQILNNILKIA